MIQTKVFQNSEAQLAGHKSFEKLTEVNDCVTIPFEQVARSLKFLFGETSVVQFNIY